MRKRFGIASAIFLSAILLGAVMTYAASRLTTVTVKAASPTCNGGKCASTVTVAAGSALTIASPAASSTSTTTSTQTTTSSSGGQWTPPQHLTWYWQLQGTLPAMTGAGLPAQADAWDIDGFDNTAQTVAALHAAGHHAICYIDVGTAENFRSDYSEFPAADLGKTNGWPGEKWLNITDPALRPIMDARFQMCKQKGFDGVEPDNMDGWENGTGFPITGAQQLAYNEWVAGDVHALGMAVFQKNDPEQDSALLPYFDGQIEEQDVQYGDDVTPYIKAGKPVLDAEYKSEPCSSNGQMQAQFDLNLTGATYKPCWS